MRKSKPMTEDRAKEVRESIPPGETAPAEQETAIVTHQFQDRAAGDTPPEEEKKKPPTQAEILDDVSQPMDFFHNTQDESFTTFTVGNHRETHALKSKAVKDYLVHGYYRRRGRPPNPQSVRQILSLLEAKARFDNPVPIDVFTRLGTHNEVLYMDMCRPDWAAIAITTEDWKIVKDVPIKFRRRPAMLPLPEPIRNGSLEPLRVLLNCQTDELFVLDVGWMVQTFHPRGPYIVGVDIGEQGCAKSWRQQTKRRIIDPVEGAGLRSMPKEERDLAIAARNSRVIAMDNLSYLPDEKSDSLCRLASGTGVVIRRLYTDDEEEIFAGSRPILLNGIESFARRSDLVDRAIICSIPQIKDTDRIEEEDLEEMFLEAWPGILGKLLDAVVMALANYRNVVLDSKPRMADATKFIVAAEPALPWEPGTFLRMYQDNRRAAVRLNLEHDCIAGAILALMEDLKLWEGTPTDLLNALEAKVSRRMIKTKPWPKSPAALTRKLTRTTTNLRSVGIEIVQDRSETERTITITKDDAPGPEKTPEDGDVQSWKNGVNPVMSSGSSMDADLQPDDTHDDNDDTAKMSSCPKPASGLDNDDNDDNDDVLPYQTTDTPKASEQDTGGQDKGYPVARLRSDLSG